MFDKCRYSEDRIPTKSERLAVRTQAKAQNKTFNEMWSIYMKREQRMLNTILRAEAKIAKAEMEIGERSNFEESDVLKTLGNMVSSLGMTPYRALATYIEGPERQEDPYTSYYKVDDKDIESFVEEEHEY